MKSLALLTNEFVEVSENLALDIGLKFYWIIKNNYVERT